MRIKALDFLLIVACTIVFIAICANVKKANAQEHPGHAQYHENAYSKWMKPYAPSESCCNMKVVKADGSVSGDCYPTRSRRVLNRDGERLLVQKDDGTWIEVPYETILRRTINPDETGVSSHLCENGGPVFCFLESTGML